jgi:hypothetical protein
MLAPRMIVLSMSKNAPIFCGSGMATLTDDLAEFELMFTGYWECNVPHCLHTDGSKKMEPRVVLIGKSECHLCENARLIIAKVCEELGETWSELSILEDPQLADQYFESIPVTMIDGKIHDKWRVDEDRLRTALLKKNK